MANVVIIHFQPIELYPPTLNLINLLAEKKDTRNNIHVITLNPPPHMARFETASSRIFIYRKGRISATDKAVARYFNYLLFYALACFQLLKRRPVTILSFETISFFPAYLYKRFFGRKAVLMVHYHEYTSPGEYKNGMKLVRWMHGMEEKMYGQMKWISHTNELRMQRFLSEHPGINPSSTHVLPNYPPASWRHVSSGRSRFPVKLVYVGALGFDTMYIREFAEWVTAQEGRLIWDIYTNNAEKKVIDYLESLGSRYIKVKGAVNYYALPPVLKEYDAGVILYKGHIQNYVLNAPNKLFEYLACGLDVWFPDVMTGSLPFVTRGTWPKVSAIDFNNLQSVNLAALVSDEHLTCKPSEYFAEKVLDPLITALTS